MPKGEPPMRRGLKSWEEAWPEQVMTLEKRRLNEGLRNLWDLNEVTDSDRHRFLTDIVGEPM